MYKILLFNCTDSENMIYSQYCLYGYKFLICSPRHVWCVLQTVPTEIWVQILTERLKLMDCVKKGYVLEGFPQTREQALALQSVGIHPKHCGRENVFAMIKSSLSYQYLNICWKFCQMSIWYDYMRTVNAYIIGIQMKTYFVSSYTWCTRHSSYWKGTRKKGGSENWRWVSIRSYSFHILDQCICIALKIWKTSFPYVRVFS